MEDGIHFTSRMSLSVVANFGDVRVFDLHLPMFVWLAHGNGALFGAVEPVFYVDDTPDVPSASHAHLLRGATEAASEEAWTIYRDLLDNGLPDQLVRQLLPANLMVRGTVTASDAELRDFAMRHRDSPIKEMALLAHAYERTLDESARDHGADHH